MLLTSKYSPSDAKCSCSCRIPSRRMISSKGPGSASGSPFSCKKTRSSHWDGLQYVMKSEAVSRTVTSKRRAFNSEVVNSYHKLEEQGCCYASEMERHNLEWSKPEYKEFELTFGLAAITVSDREITVALLTLCC